MKNETENLTEISQIKEEFFKIAEGETKQVIFQGYIFTLSHNPTWLRPYYVDVIKKGTRRGRSSIQGFTCATFEQAMDFFKRKEVRINKLRETKSDRKVIQDAVKSAFVNPYKPGDILYRSWGYDQTNVDFYQVVKTTKFSVSMRPLNKEYTEDGFMCGKSHAIKDSFSSEKIMKKQFSFWGYNGQARLGDLSQTNETRLHRESHYA